MRARFDEGLSAVEVEYKEVPFRDEYEINVIEFDAEVSIESGFEIEEHSLDKDLVERVGGELAIIEALQKTVMRDLCVPKDSKTEDYLHRLDDKVVGFYCTIPEE